MHAALHLGNRCTSLTGACRVTTCSRWHCSILRSRSLAPSRPQEARAAICRMRQERVSNGNLPANNGNLPANIGVDLHKLSRRYGPPLPHANASALRTAA